MMHTLMDYFFVFLLTFLAIVFVAGGLVFSRLVAPRRPSLVKNATYECGEQPIGNAWIQFNVGYYLFGLLFLIFDVEAAVLFACAVALRRTGMVGLIEMVLFIFVLFFGLVYAWKKGALEWV